VAARLSEDRTETPDLVRLLIAARWQAAGAERTAVDRLIEREVARIAKAVNWRAALSVRDPALQPGVQRLRRALAQEAVAAGRHLTDLLGLVYDRQLMNRVGRVLEGSTQGDAGISIESLDLALAPHHRGQVIRALKSAFAPEQAESQGLLREELARKLEDLARDCRWAVWPDWLLACVLAALGEARGGRKDLDGVAALGPVSAELLEQG
jgi:hypothetical protein